MGGGSSSEAAQAPGGGNPNYGATSNATHTAAEVNRTIVNSAFGIMAGGTYPRPAPPPEVQKSPLFEWARSVKGTMRILTPIFLYVCSLNAFAWFSFFYLRSLVVGLLAGIGLNFFFYISVPKDSRHKASTRYSAASCSLALLLGAVVGGYLHEAQVQMYYAHFEGETYSNVVPSQTADTFADAALVTFEKEAYVMRGKSVGAQPIGDPHKYCVAPILAKQQENDVQFWAVGTDCCDWRDNFWCDAALDEKSQKAGVVVFDVGLVKTEADQYRAAIRIAEAENELRGDDDALLVRWVQASEAAGIVHQMLVDAWWALVVAMLIGALPFVAGGVAAARALQFEEFSGSK